jgi:outer membrane protein assembly factor BamA
MDITMIVDPSKTSGHNEIYTFANVYIFPDERAGRAHERTFDTTTVSMPRSRTDTTKLDFHFVHSQPLQIRPQVIASKLAIRPGEPFSLTTVDRTYENLLDLRVFRSTSVSVQPQPVDTANPEFLLNTIVEVQQAPVNMWVTEFEVTNASSLQGTNISTSLQNRNFFGGAEIFSLRLRGLVEAQYLLNKTEREDQGVPLIDNFDIGISANLDFPRFIAPFYVPHGSVSRARTLVSLGYSYRFRLAYYNRQVVGASFAYSWRQPRVSHTFFPLDINWVNISLTSAFRDTLDKISEHNRRLKYQYENHFIFASRYNFSFSGQQGNRPISFNAFRFSIESSGNSLYLLSNLIDARKHDDQYHFLHLPYAQYIRADADFRRYWRLTDNQFLVTRLMGGVGFAYANSIVLPYEKGFFAGGNNNIRAWPMNQLGPGSFYDPNLPNVEHIGDMVLVGNIEYRFPIRNAFKGALFIDAGNIWIRDAESYPNGEFSWQKMPNDLAVGGGVGLRWDLGFFVIRLDAAAPLRNPAKPNGEKWVVENLKIRNFALNFGIGYPF